MKFTLSGVLTAVVLIVVGLGFAAAGFYIGETDDAPGAALIGILLMSGTVILALRIIRRTMFNG